MKINNLYIVATFLVFFISACSEDWLKVTPSDALMPENAFTTVTDAETALRGVYSTMQSEDYYGADILTYGSVKGDACRTSKAGKRTDNQYGYQETADASTTTLWTAPYNALMLVNNILERIDALETAGAEEETKKNDIKGQALALRALFHFDLVRVFGKMPANGTPATDLGVPIADKVFTVDDEPSRATVKAVYDFIISDLEDAVTLLKTDVDASIINKYGAQALLSRVYLFYNEDAKALSNAEAVINSNAYDLLTTANYLSSWDGTPNSETIFNIVNTLDDSPQREGLYYLWLPEPDGYGAITLTDNMIAELKADPNDVRSGLATDYEGDNRFGYLKKWTPFYDCNLIVIRLSEVYLNAAEAAFKENNMPKALEYMNTLLENRTGVTDTYTTLTLDDILYERNKELVGEGHRFFDLMRNGKPVQRTGSDHLTQAPMLINPTDFNVIQPIPRFETDVNPNLVQNDNY